MPKFAAKARLDEHGPALALCNAPP